MLSNLIGIVLAFVTIMLLLSLVVMALVQLTQATLRLRGRNLIVGLSALIDSEGLRKTAHAAPDAERVPDPARGPDAAKTPKLRRRQEARQAAEVLNATAPAKLRPSSDPNSVMNIVRGPAMSWVEPNDLARAIVATHPNEVSTQGHTEESLSERFRALEPAMSDRFARTMQMYTSLWAIVVAIVFQVSTPSLLITLSTSDAKREAAISLVPTALKQSEAVVPAAMTDDFVDRALGQLVQTYSDRQELKELFDQVSGSTDSRQDMLDELHAVLAGVPDREDIVRKYAEIIDRTNTTDFRTALATASDAMNSLDVIDIRPWGSGPRFYLSGANIVGVLITAILLSFGAPFWFEQLKNVASLRDALSKNKQPQGA